MCSFFGIKCCFIFFNTLFLLSGVALITIGVLQYSMYSDIGTFTGSNLSKIAIVLIAVGVIIAFVSLLGHIGAFLNSSSMVACGCLWAISVFLLKNLVWVGAVCIALGVTEVFGVLVGVRELSLGCWDDSSLRTQTPVREWGTESDVRIYFNES